MAAQRRKEEAEAFNLATQQALICAPASPTKSSPQRVSSKNKDDDSIDQDCHILRLSPEILNRIYYYAMDNDFLASLDPISSRYPDAVKTRAKTPALMRTCNQMRIEAGDIWYSETVFIYRLDVVLYQWLKLIGPNTQKLIRTVRRDCISLTKRWAEAYVAFTHARLRDQKLILAEDAIEVAFWEPKAPTAAVPEVRDSTKDATLTANANAALISMANAALNTDEALGSGSTSGEVFEFDPDLELGNFAENFLDKELSDDVTAICTGSTRKDSAVGSVAESNGSATSGTTTPRCSKEEPGDKKKKAKKPTKSSASSVTESGASSKDAEKKEKAEKKAEKKKKKDSPSSLAESVMSTKSGKGDKTKEKKPAKPKVKKEPEPEKTWAFVRMETVRL